MEEARAATGEEHSRSEAQAPDAVECPGKDCPYCNGEACAFCNLPAMASDVIVGNRPPCDHDVLDRHPG
jgi:hypothetical protein